MQFSAAKTIIAIMLALAVLACQVNGIAAPYLKDHFSSAVRTLGTGDAVVLVDFWQSRKCLETIRTFDELATKTNLFAGAMRSNNATVFIALSGSSQLREYTSNASIRARFWFPTKKQKALASRMLPKAKDQAELWIKKAREAPPLDIFTSARNTHEQRYCNGTHQSTRSSRSLHPNIEFNLDRDYMFDSGYFFNRMAAMGIRRLYYVGGALNECVLLARTFSALEASLSGKFDEVGIILDLTQANIRRDIPQPGCRGLSDNQCVNKFAAWVMRYFKAPGLSFWNYQ